MLLRSHTSTDPSEVEMVSLEFLLTGSKTFAKIWRLRLCEFYKKVATSC